MKATPSVVAMLAALLTACAVSAVGRPIPPDAVRAIERNSRSRVC